MKNLSPYVEFAGYFACSALALGADFSIFIMAMRLGVGYPLAALAGFMVGLWVAYRLSVRFVFRARACTDEKIEFIIFAVIGLVGLLLTEALLWLLLARAGLPPSTAKLITAGVVFGFNFCARKAMLFTRYKRVVIA